MNLLSFDTSNVLDIRVISKKFDLEILEALGVGSINHEGVQCQCPIHGGDNPTAFCYDTSKKIWSCFTQQCHKKYGNDIIGLIRSVNNLSFEGAVDWIKLNVDIDPNIDMDEARKSIENSSSYPSINNENVIIPNSKISNLSSGDSFAINRGFNKGTAKRFEAGICDSGKIIHQRLMVPIRNLNGLIVGFTGRSIHSLNESTGGYHPDNFKPSNNSGKLFSKWRNYPKKFNKSIELYNIHNAKEEISRTNTCYVVEGPFDVWKMWEFGVSNCVATLGTTMSVYQRDILVDLNCMILNIIYDSDKAGKIASESIGLKFKDDFCINSIVLPKGLDPASMTEKIFKERILNEL